MVIHRPYHVHRLWTKYRHSSFAGLCTYCTVWCNSWPVPCMLRDMVIFSLADKATHSALLLPNHTATAHYLPKFSSVPPCTSHLWRDMEEKGVRAVVQQDKTGKGEQGENKGHCVTCHHHAPEGHGELGGICWERHMMHHQGPWIELWLQSH